MDRRNGFTLVEVVIAIMFVAILLGIASSAFGSVQERLATEQAVRAFQGLHARTRAQAVEAGSLARMIVDVTGDSVTVRRGGQILETVRFRDELGVDLRGVSFVLCMGSRGYADTDCNSFKEPVKLGFNLGQDTDVVVLLPMGQLLLQ